MSFPAYGIVPPTLSSYQLSFNGYTFGFNTALEIMKINGFDLPNVRSGDSGRPRDHGLFAGEDLLAGGELEVEAQLRPIATESFNVARAALAKATAPSGSIESPLFFNLPGFGTLATMARCRKRKIPVDIKSALGLLSDVALLFNSTDPRWFQATQQTNISTPFSLSGATYNLKYPVGWGGGVNYGNATINNTGNFDCRPIIQLEGPLVNPVIQNINVPGQPSIGFILTMKAGDVLVLDTDLHTATFTPAETTESYSRMGTFAPGSQWWVLPGESNSTIRFMSSGGLGEGTCKVQWANAILV